MTSKVIRVGVAFLLLVSTGSTLVAQSPGQARRGRPRINQGSLKDGDAAPDFALRDVAGMNEVQLSDLRKKPVVLIFGSCTCPPFVASLKSVEELHTQYKDRVQFYIVYVRKAHPTDGRVIANNQFQVKSPKTLTERQAIGKDFAEKLNVSIPVLVDSIDDHVEQAYSGWPNRMYVIGADGKIVDKGTAGPGGVAGSARRAAQLLDDLLKRDQ